MQISHVLFPTLTLKDTSPAAEINPSFRNVSESFVWQIAVFGVVITFIYYYYLSRLV